MLVDTEEGTISFDLSDLRGVYARTCTNKFQFSGTFGPMSSQDDVFRIVALPIVESSMSGINGTIFAYGQTVW